MVVTIWFDAYPFPYRLTIPRYAQSVHSFMYPFQVHLCLHMLFTSPFNYEAIFIPFESWPVFETSVEYETISACDIGRLTGH